MRIREIIRNKIYGCRADSQRYIEHLRSIGVQVGENVSIYTPTKTTIDEQYPWLITIGNNVKIAQGAVILCHDYAWSVIKSTTGAILGASGKVTIGNNVFIGMNAIIARNVTIGDNVIIGAGSVVTKDCQGNSVYAGNPARYIASLDDYVEKRQKAQFAEARELAVEYHKRFGRMPPVEVFHEFFMLFETAESARTKKWCENKMHLNGNYAEAVAYLESRGPMFDGYEAFLQACFMEKI